MTLAFFHSIWPLYLYPMIPIDLRSLSLSIRSWPVSQFYIKHYIFPHFTQMWKPWLLFTIRESCVIKKMSQNLGAPLVRRDWLGQNVQQGATAAICTTVEVKRRYSSFRWYFHQGTRFRLPYSNPTFSHSSGGIWRLYIYRWVLRITSTNVRRMMHCVQGFISLMPVFCTGMELWAPIEKLST